MSELPKTATGKLQRFKLRDLQAEQGQKCLPVEQPETEV
jgi:acyl-coenzyme A synthetase/AMP-(fatty) acid ligase